MLTAAVDQQPEDDEHRRQQCDPRQFGDGSHVQHLCATGGRGRHHVPDLLQRRAEQHPGMHIAEAQKRIQQREGDDTQHPEHADDRDRLGNVVLIGPEQRGCGDDGGRSADGSTHGQQPGQAARQAEQAPQADHSEQGGDDDEQVKQQHTESRAVQQREVQAHTQQSMPSRSSVLPVKRMPGSRPGVRRAETPGDPEQQRQAQWACVTEPRHARQQERSGTEASHQQQAGQQAYGGPDFRLICGSVLWLTG